MERKRIRKSFGLIPCTIALVLGATACASALDRARVAWDDGAGSYDAAERHYKEAIAKGGSDGDEARAELLELNFLLAQDLHKKKPKDAERHYRNVIELDPDHEDAREALSRLLMTQYRHDEALDVAQAGVQRKTCRGCKRLVAVLLVARGDNRLAQDDPAGAEADYAAALAMLPDADTSLALARARVVQKDHKGGAEALRVATETIGRDDLPQRARYLELRREVVLLALDAGDVTTADEMMDLAPIGVGPSEQLGLALEAAMRFSALGKPDDALARMRALVQAAEAGKMQLAPARADELRDAVADLLAARAMQRIAEGDETGAKDDIAEALRLRPQNANVALVEILMLAQSGQVAAAKGKHASIDQKIKGRAEVGALLEVMDVDKLVAAGKLGDAKAAIERAKSAGGADLPEVHIAIAEVLAASEVEGLKKTELDALKSNGMVKYPAGRPTRVGEALSEIEWAAKARTAQGQGWPFRAPGFDARAKALAAKIGAYYPFAVQFRNEPSALLVLQNQAPGQISVAVRSVDAAKGLDQNLDVGPDKTAEVTVGRPGVVTLEYDGKKRALLAEPHTHVRVAL